MVVDRQTPASLIAFQQGTIPLLISFPHSGTWLPASVKEQMTDVGLRLPDTDWELPRLYEFATRFHPSTIAAEFSRYLIDPNRSTDGINLYPGKPTPQLCPTETFAGEPIYAAGEAPSDMEIDRRTREFWKPYHQKIQEELVRLRAQFGFAVLFDAHSIKSEVPRLFDGKLPDINIGTANGTSCDPSLASAIEEALNSQQSCSFVMNGRFIGGHITRAFGRPAEGIHAVQLELAQCRYMDESLNRWNENAAHAIRPILECVLEAIVRWIAAWKP